MGPSSNPYFLQDYDGELQVRPVEDYRATRMKLFSVRRPHMRGFHFAWLSMFVAFFGLFALAPVMSVIEDDLGISADDVRAGNLAAIVTNIVARLVVGPLCDRYGPKRIQFYLLLVGGICLFFAPAVSNGAGILLIRFLTGVLGASFVCATYWATVLFTKDAVGTAQAIITGWGYLGAAVAYVAVAALYTNMRSNGEDPEEAWRYAVCIPAALILVIAVAMFCLSDDSPRGDFKTLQWAGAMRRANMMDGMKKALYDSTVWVLAAQFAGSAGVLVVVQQALVTVFVDEYDVGIVAAASIAVAFAFASLFARAVGGIASDYANHKKGFPGRLRLLMGTLLAAAVSLIIFTFLGNFYAAVVFLALFCFFVQAAQAAIFAIVPYVNPLGTGAVAGVVAAGGSFGALVWTLVFLYSGMSSVACVRVVAFLMFGVSFLTPLIRIRGLGARILCNEKQPSKAELSWNMHYGADAPVRSFRSQWGAAT